MPHADPEARKQNQKKWRMAHQDELREYNRQYRVENRERYNAVAARTHRRRMRAARLEIINAMGGGCQICGINDIRVLHIDHTNGGGNEHRRQVRGTKGYTSKYYFDLLKMYLEDPASLSLLCANCHAIKHWKEVED